MSPERTRAKRMRSARWPRGMASRRARTRSVVGSVSSTSGTSGTSTVLLLSCLDSSGVLLLSVVGGGRMVASVT